MAQNFWLLVTIVCVELTATVAGTVKRSGTLIEEVDMDVDGQLVHQKREVDLNCRYVKTTATLPDGSTTTSNEDFERGVEVFQSSSDPDVCYVRLLTDGERRMVSTCQDGLVQRDPSAPEVEVQMLQRGPKAPQVILSTEQREQCDGLDVYILVHAHEGRMKREACRIGPLGMSGSWRCQDDGVCYLPSHALFPCPGEESYFLYAPA